MADLQCEHVTSNKSFNSRSILVAYTYIMNTNTSTKSPSKTKIWESLVSGSYHGAA